MVEDLKSRVIDFASLDTLAKRVAAVGNRGSRCARLRDCGARVAARPNAERRWHRISDGGLRRWRVRGRAGDDAVARRYDPGAKRAAGGVDRWRGVFGGARVIRGAERPAEAWLCDSHRARRRGADLSRTCAWPARAFGSDRTLCCCDLELRIDRNAIGCVRSQLRLLFPGHQRKCPETPFRPLSPSGAGRVCIHVTAGAVMFATWKIIQSSIKCRRNRRLRLGNNSQ
jgi:hypothetical protein